MSLDEPSLTVAVCTRGRPAQLRTTLAALEAEEAPFDLLVIDQSASLREGDTLSPLQGGGSDPPPTAGEGQTPLGEVEGLRREVVRDEGVGLSRARNLALARARTTWIAFVDDDCVVDQGFVAALRGELAGADGVDWVSGDVRAGGPAVDGLPVTTLEVAAPRRHSGRWTLPGRIGFGVMFCVRCSTARELGGWDERLGPGIADFPAADDMDFNYRLLRSGGTAALSPKVRARHEQWRTEADLPALQRGYLRAWSGFAMKHLRSGDVAGGLWLWLWGVVDMLDMLASAASRRSGFRLKLTAAKLRGLIEGTVKGAARRW